MNLKGRHWLLFWLVYFLVVTTLVVARQQSALRTSRALGELRKERAALEARRAELEQRLRTATSRQTLGARAERDLGLHNPADTEFVTFTVPDRPAEDH